MLKELENKLKTRRYEVYKHFKSNIAGSNNLQPPVIQNIETGKNYKFTSLLKFIEALNLKLYINDTQIKEPGDLGKCIKKYRHDNDLTQYQVMLECNFNPSKIMRLERGICSRNSLETFLNHYPDFNLAIKEIYE